MNSISYRNNGLHARANPCASFIAASQYDGCAASAGNYPHANAHAGDAPASDRGCISTIAFMSSSALTNDDDCSLGVTLLYNLQW